MNGSAQPGGGLEAARCGRHRRLHGLVAGAVLADQPHGIEADLVGERADIRAAQHAAGQTGEVVALHRRQ